MFVRWEWEKGGEDRGGEGQGGGGEVRREARPLGIGSCLDYVVEIGIPAYEDRVENSVGRRADMYLVNRKEASDLYHWVSRSVLSEGLAIMLERGFGVGSLYLWLNCSKGLGDIYLTFRRFLAQVFGSLAQSSEIG